MMDKPEPLILDYNLTDWMNQTYTGIDPNKRCQPTLKESYRGLRRISAVSVAYDDDDADDGNDEPVF